MVINLLPWRQQLERQKKTSFFLSSLGSFIIAVSFSLIGYCWLKQNIEHYCQANAYLQEKINGSTNSSMLANNLHFKQLFALLQLLARDQENQYNYFATLLILQENLSPETSLKNIVLQKKEFFLTGEARSLQSVKLLVQSLEQQTYVKNVKISHIYSSENSSEKNTQFLLSGSYANS